MDKLTFPTHSSSFNTRVENVTEIVNWQYWVDDPKTSVTIIPAKITNLYSFYQNVIVH